MQNPHRKKNNQKCYFMKLCIYSDRIFALLNYCAANMEEAFRRHFMLAVQIL